MDAYTNLATQEALLTHKLQSKQLSINVLKEYQVSCEFYNGPYQRVQFQVRNPYVPMGQVRNISQASTHYS